MNDQLSDHQPNTSSPTISVRKAVAIGHLLVSLPVIVIILGFTFLGGQFAPHFILIFLFVGIILGWLWWAFTVPRWRRWALHRGAQPDELQKLAASTGLVWPKGSIFEKTEFKVDEWPSIDKMKTMKIKK